MRTLINALNKADNFEMSHMDWDSKTGTMTLHFKSLAMADLCCRELLQEGYSVADALGGGKYSRVILKVSKDSIDSIE